jgi:hypothetical protein
VTADRALRVLAALAVDQVRSPNRTQARTAMAAVNLIGNARLAAVRDPRICAAIYAVLKAVSLLQLPLRGYRRAHRDRNARDPIAAPRKFTDEQLSRALVKHASIKEVAHALGCDRRTISRRVRSLVGHGVLDVPFASALSLRRSQRRSKREQAPHD